MSCYDWLDTPCCQSNPTACDMMQIVVLILLWLACFIPAIVILLHRRPPVQSGRNGEENESPAMPRTNANDVFPGLGRVTRVHAYWHGDPIGVLGDARIFDRVTLRLFSLRGAEEAPPMMQPVEIHRDVVLRFDGLSDKTSIPFLSRITWTADAKVVRFEQAGLRYVGEIAPCCIKSSKVSP